MPHNRQGAKSPETRPGEALSEATAVSRELTGTKGRGGRAIQGRDGWDVLGHDRPGEDRPGWRSHEILTAIRAAERMKRLWRLDIAVLVRHDVCMDGRDLKRLGHHVVSRRVALGFRNRTDLADSLQFTVRTLSDIEHGVRKASAGSYAILENKLAWAPGSIDTILSGGEPNATVVELRRTTSAPLSYAPSDASSRVSTEELLLELRRRIIAPHTRRPESWDGLDPHGE
jgi:hypothetical protein